MLRKRITKARLGRLGIQISSPPLFYIVKSLWNQRPPLLIYNVVDYVELLFFFRIIQRSQQRPIFQGSRRASRLMRLSRPLLSLNIFRRSIPLIITWWKTRGACPPSPGSGKAGGRQDELILAYIICYHDGIGIVDW